MYVYIVFPRTSADVLRKLDFRFSHMVSWVKLSVQGDVFGLCCRSTWNLGFTFSRHKGIYSAFAAGLLETLVSPSPDTRGFIRPLLQVYLKPWFHLLPTQGDLFGLCCRSTWNLGFTFSRHKGIYSAFAAGLLETLVSPSPDTTGFIRPLLQVCLTYIDIVDIVDIECFVGIYFLLGLGFGLRFMLTADQTMVSWTLCTGHHSGVQEAFHVPLAHKHLVK